MLSYRAGHILPRRAGSRDRRTRGWGIVRRFGGRRAVRKRMPASDQLDIRRSDRSIRAATLLRHHRPRVARRRDKLSLYASLRIRRGGPAARSGSVECHLENAASRHRGPDLDDGCALPRNGRSYRSRANQGNSGCRDGSGGALRVCTLGPRTDFFVSRTSPTPWDGTAPISRKAKPTAPETHFRCWAASSRHCLRPAERWPTRARSERSRPAYPSPRRWQP